MSHPPNVLTASVIIYFFRACPADLLRETVNSPRTEVTPYKPHSTYPRAKSKYDVNK